MEQDVETCYRTVCSTCLSSDRDLFSLTNSTHLYQIFRLLMYDFAGDRLGEAVPEMEQFACWECLGLMKKFLKFKWQVHSAQEHLRVVALSGSQENIDHTYMSQSLSSLTMQTKVDYDKIFFDYTFGGNENEYTTLPESSHSVKNEEYDVIQAVKNNINLDLDTNMLEVPQIVLENPMTGIMSHIVVGGEVVKCDSFTHSIKGEEMPHITIASISTQKPNQKPVESTVKPGYITEYMSEREMLDSREEAKQKVQYVSSVYKCELCIISFYAQHQVEDHFVSVHKPKPGQKACKVCYVYLEPTQLLSHVDNHYLRYICKMCGHVEYSAKIAQIHAKSHLTRQLQHVINIGNHGSNSFNNKKKKESQKKQPPPKPGDLRKLLSKTVIEGYQCLECDMFFKTARARKSHVARYHREGYHCDHCKKRFVNKTTLTTHLRLHEGPLPRDECPICHKMVRVIQLKYHIRRHESKGHYECTDCNKVFSHLTTYQAHLRYSRAHASDQVFKFPCPMCNKGYPTKETMQDHFNYQHLGKTSHKCPICEKPIASKANVEKHLMRIHGEKKEKPRKHICQMCGKGFTDKKALTQHEVIHSGERPLACEFCNQTFKQKASLYTHKKRVHKVTPNKRVLQYMETATQC